MRYYWLTLAGTLLLGGALRGQQPPAPPAEALDPARNRLDALLLRWEQEMKGVQSLAAQCNRTTIDKTFQVTELYEGTARFLKPNMAVLEMVKKNKPDVFEKFVCTGTYLYVFLPQEKAIKAYELAPSASGQVGDDSFLGFLFGMKAQEAKRRYDLKLVKEDQWYVYIEIIPKLPADKADFQKARLVLSNQSFMPRELWFEQPNGNEVKWDIPRIESGAQVNRTEFTAPAVPPGWSMTRVPRATQVQPPNNEVPPRVIRQNQ